MDISKYIDLITTVGQAYDTNTIIGIIVVAVLFVFTGISVYFMHRTDDHFYTSEHVINTDMPDEWNRKAIELYKAKVKTASKYCMVFVLVSIAILVVSVTCALIPSTPYAMRHKLIDDNSRICMQCGTGNTKNVNYCISCGDEINEGDIITAVAWKRIKKSSNAGRDMNICSHCMEVVSGNAKHCPNCGNSIE